MTNKLLRPARWLTFLIGAAFSLLAINAYIYVVQLVTHDPALVLPDDTLWTFTQLVNTLAGLGLPGAFYAVYTLGITLVFSLTFFACGWLILLRRSHDWFGMYLALLLLSWANGVGLFSSMPKPSWDSTVHLGWFMWPGLFLLLYFFPSGHVIPRWTRWFALIWALFCVYGLTTSILGVLPENFSSAFPILFSVLLVGIYAQIYRYRHAAALERQQIKLVVFSLILFAAFFIITALVQNVFGYGDPQKMGFSGALIFNLLFFTAFNLIFMGIPITIAVAVLRYRLWDIDIVIRKTLVYAALTATLIFVYFGSVILLQSLVNAIGGQQSAVVTVISTLLIAALFTPLRRRIQNDIDRRFYRKKYDAERTIAAFSANLRDEVDLDEMCLRLVSVVEETLQPEMISLTMLKKK